MEKAKRKKQDATARVFATIPAPLKKRFDHAVIEVGRNKQDIIAELIEQYVNQQEAIQKT